MRVCTTGCIFRRCLQRRILRETVGADSQGGIGEKTYRIYHPGGVRYGGRSAVRAATSHFAGVNFPTRNPVSPPVSPRPDDGKWYYGYSICFFAYTLITPGPETPRDISWARVSWIQTTTTTTTIETRASNRPMSRLLFVRRAPKARRGTQTWALAVYCECRFAQAGRMHNWGDARSRWSIKVFLTRASSYLYFESYSNYFILICTRRDLIGTGNLTKILYQ